MALSVFSDKAKQPKDKELPINLEAHFFFGTNLKETSQNFLDPWTLSGAFQARTHWGLRLKKENRAIVYLIPCEGFFLSSFALGEKAVKAAHECDLPLSVLEVIDSTKKYVERRGGRLEVKSSEDVFVIEKFAGIKMGN
jgi:hypothetical protein